MTKECNRCGNCCTNPSYMGTLMVSGEDVKRWCREGRGDILEWVDILGPSNDPYGDVWINLTTGEEKLRCPFVRKDPNKPTYRCTIYETRPQVCKDYVPWTEYSVCVELQTGGA